MNNSKIIGVGFHKTGLSSLMLALEILGYPTTKGRQSFKHELQEQDIISVLNTKNTTELFQFLTPYQAVVDMPWYLLFRELDSHFPNSKFILTIREENNWINSAKNYFKHRPGAYLRNWIYGKEEVEGNESDYIARYRQHNQEVLAYFKDRPDDLLIMDLEKGDGWDKLCPFLAKPTLHLPFPMQNRNLIEEE